MTQVSCQSASALNGSRRDVHSQNMISKRSQKAREIACAACNFKYPLVAAVFHNANQACTPSLFVGGVFKVPGVTLSPELVTEVADPLTSSLALIHLVLPESSVARCFLK